MNTLVSGYQLDQRQRSDRAHGITPETRAGLAQFNDRLERDDF